MPRLKTPHGARELGELRTHKSKHFDFGNGQRSVVISARAVHVPRALLHWKADRRRYNRGYDDLDLSLVDDGAVLTVSNAYYGLQVEKGVVGFKYTSRIHGGTLAVRLLEVGNAPVGTLPQPEREGDRLIWRNVAPGNDFWLDLRSDTIEIYKAINNASAARKFKWHVERSGAAIWSDESLKTKGHDNHDLTDPQRAADLMAHGPGNPVSGPGRLCRSLIMLPPVKGPETTVGGVTSFDWVEEWSGQTVFRDAKRVAIPSNDTAYPALIDVLVTENIGADADDGYQFGSDASTGSTWQTTYASTGKTILYDPASGSLYMVPGWRFTSVGVPQGATISSANLALSLAANSSGVGTAATVYGNDVDDAPAWANGAGPINMTRTTASVSFGSWGGNQANPTARNLDITAIVQEIVDRPGFAGGAMAFGVSNFTQNNNSAFHYIDDLSGGGSPAVLTINYVAGGGSSIMRPAGGIGTGGMQSMGGGTQGRARRSTITVPSNYHASGDRRALHDLRV